MNFPIGGWFSFISNKTFSKFFIHLFTLLLEIMSRISFPPFKDKAETKHRPVEKESSQCCFICHM